MLWFLVLVALGIAIWSKLSVSKASGKLEDLHYELYGLKNKQEELERRFDGLSKKVNKFLLEKQQEQGELRFNSSMTLAQVLSAHPSAASVLAQFNLGGCSMCASVDSETLEQAAQSHGFDLTELLAALNAIEG